MSKKKEDFKLDNPATPKPKGKLFKDMGTAELGLASFALHNQIQQVQNDANKAISQLRGELAGVGTELKNRDKAEKES